VKGGSNGKWVLVALGAAAVAYVLLVLAPNHRAIMELRELILVKRGQVLQGAGIALAIETSKKDLARAKACIAAWDTNAPKEKDRAVLFGKINELAKTAGVVSTRFEPEPVTRRDRLVEIPLTIGVTGSFAQIEAFLYSLERLPVTSWVDSLKLASGKDGHSVTGEIKVVIFTVNSEISDYVKVAEKPIN
jgi:Tfp pilus assembly protein PilO